MANSTDLFARRNRLRIIAVVVLATINYMLAVALAAVAVTLGFIIAAMFNFDIFPSDGDEAKIISIGIGAIVVLSFVVGLLVALFKIPFARRRLERQVLRETGATIADGDAHREVKNLLEALAIPADIDPPRFAVIDDPAPNSFGVGTRPSKSIIGVTTGLSAVLSRDELEAVLAYEVSRIKSWDIALSSWTVALTGGAISAADSDDDQILRALFGFVPRKLGEMLQVWALRDQGKERDRTAVQFTRNPLSLIRALEKLDADEQQVTRVTRATAPLWIEFPKRALGSSGSRATRRLANELLLDERIDHLRALASLPPETPTPPETTTAPS
jgi:heat shock protein HtpX